jgi:ankyrin repeat protein
MARQTSDKEEKRLFLCFDVLARIIMIFLKDNDIYNFIRASKMYYEQFHDTFLLQNVLYGQCTALKRANAATIEKMLDFPITEVLVPCHIWPRMVDKFRGHIGLVRRLLQVDCVRASIKEEALENAAKGIDTWMDRGFDDSWLRVMFNAIRSDQADVVDLLLSLGLTVESHGRDGSQAMEVATRGCASTHLVQLLLEKYKADPNQLSELSYFYDTPLFWAASRGSVEVVKLLLEHKADPCYGERGGFCRPLVAAIPGGHKDVVKVLLRDQRIRPNAPDANGMTILCHAIQHGRTDIVQMLLDDKRIDPNATIDGSDIPLLVAASNSVFSQRNELTMTKLLLSDERVDVFLRDGAGRSALFYAAQYGLHEVLELYLNDGRLDPNEADEVLNTPILCTDHRKCFQLLINDTRVDLNKAGHGGMTPLMKHASYAQLAHVDQLLELERVDVNQQDNQGNTAMIIAVRDSNIRYYSGDEFAYYCTLLMMMLDSGRVNLDLTNANGETALMVAVKNNSASAVKAILATGHRMIDMKDAKGGTMIEYAVRGDSMGIVRMLLQTREVQVTQEIIDSAQSTKIRDMLLKYKCMMDQRATRSTLADVLQWIMCWMERLVW